MYQLQVNTIKIQKGEKTKDLNGIHLNTGVKEIQLVCPCGARPQTQHQALTRSSKFIES